MLAIPVITLLSDLGTPHIAISGAKVLLAAANPQSAIIDVSHRIASYNIQQAAYLSRYTAQHFKPGTVHLLLIDIQYGERHRMLLAAVDGQFFIAPDNGVLSLAFKDSDAVWLCREFSEPVSVLQWIQYATGVIEIIKAGHNFNEYYSRFMIKEVAQLAAHKPIGARLDCTILHIDRYGNIVIDLTRAQFQEMAGDGPFSIQLPKEKTITTISDHYNDVAHGELLCRFNSMDYLEIAISHGSVAHTYKFDIAADKGTNYRVITINF